MLAQKNIVPMGNSVVYDEADEIYSLDQMYLEWSDNGRGDYRQSPTELKMPDGTFVSDFVYASHEIREGSVPMETLPSAYGGDQTLVVTLRDTTVERHPYVVLHGFCTSKRHYPPGGFEQ